MDLGILYALAGVACGVFVYRASPERGKVALFSAALTVPLWPLWLPVVLASNASRRASQARTTSSAEAALQEAFEAVRGTPLEALLPREAVERILNEIRRASERHAELCVVLGSKAFDLNAAQARLERLERERASARTLASARLHLENVQRLADLAERDRRALEELAELVSALRTQLVLARYAGSSANDAGDIVAEVLARVEVLGTTMETPYTEDAPESERYASREARVGSG